MKSKISFIAFALFIAFAILLSFKTSVLSCDGYYPVNVGTKFQVTTYDKKNSAINVSNAEVIKTTAQGVLVHIISKDAKGKEMLNTDFDVICDGNSIIQDQKKLITKQVTAKMTDPSVQADVSGNNPVTPNQLTVGQTLPDNEIVIAIKAGTMNMNMNFKTYNRKVIGQESVTVPAGTFDCMVVTSNSDHKLMINSKNTTKTWIAKGVGLVKQETYTTSGKLEKTELLTAFSK